MSVLSPMEKQIARELLYAGYKKAAESFSALTKQKITMKPARVEISQNEVAVVNNLKNSDGLVLITTTIIGELSGRSYLLVDRFEAAEIYKACMPYSENEESRTMEMEAILKELDNIISAAVITEFSNFLDVMVFGDVPVLNCVDQRQLKHALHNDFKVGDQEYFIVADAVFVSENNARLRPQFIWKLTQGFVSRIRDNISNQNKMLK